MPNFGSETGNVLYLIVCGAPPAADTPQLVKEKQDEGWDVVVIATPHGLQWFDPDEVERLTGHPVRSEFRKPGDPEFGPRGDAVLVAPATFNTINKWALGINDTLRAGTPQRRSWIRCESDSDSDGQRRATVASSLRSGSGATGRHGRHLRRSGGNRSGWAWPRLAPLAQPYNDSRRHMHLCLSRPVAA